MCPWFDAYSLDGIHERQDLQIDGLKESVSHIMNTLKNEIDILGGKTSHVCLGGISQWMTTALWTLFCAADQIRQPVGGCPGFCGWLPFAKQVKNLVQRSQKSNALDKQLIQRLVADSFHRTISDCELSQVNETVDIPILTTPVFLSHGSDDARVSVDLGRQAARVLQQTHMSVQRHEFSGAEGDGHWIKEPEGFDQTINSLREATTTLS
ncbi:hypothetical protein BDV29DRAFT_164381 [Aspergillus leporis]|jgi:pimeloyl-ACP methyl ester carboxylesterase|uniref:Alpha/Beta hydrolase protein n=1 Tax=Aspergillus leporis TaxID=41062 RepID=A0A5N5XIK8_9EURO|nr:hypothetical protein BDV29DRAFT_164381 [Aspergillus leporis]